MPVPVPARPKAWVCGSSLDGIVGSNFAGAWMFVSCECCVLLIPGVQTCSYPTAKHVYKYGKVHKHANVHPFLNLFHRT